ncbi:flagellar basal-body rod protein FlgB [Caloranaerobacter azorensis DSM 13643]|uniref:Flagellar basal body rod protein FlgB n=1 Tax=Caloranaerobacter azorensis DSM 13643 TaxID=1121264 RepID=A0A1M5RMQ4_9FIRM|nr:flagellar basal body rod protein FlgB [Caloranaerobacter azorensis]SHH27594.1 flagellar basal-body rod protein FlgB [Caloranaerobacter azorensis DSM 13643]
MFDKMFSTVNFLNFALNGTWLRHEAISNNIANANTPGYKRVRVEFENILKENLEDKSVKLEVTNKLHIRSRHDNFEPIVVKEINTSTRLDENNVDIDIEMAELAKNTIMYNALIRQTISEFGRIKSVINEGRR